ncbi:MAG: hypothetical protein ACKN83_07420 [Vulcanococcus sp.]
MAPDPLESLRLTLMQEVLPVGIALVERARRGGPRELAEVFSGAEDPLGRLRQEGDPAARDLRDSLDRLQPGLGNPVMKVQVRDIPSPDSSSPGEADAVDERRELQEALGRIGARLALLEQRLGPPA